MVKLSHDEQENFDRIIPVATKEKPDTEQEEHYAIPGTDMTIRLDDLPQNDLQKLVVQIVSRMLQADIQKKVAKSLVEEIEQIDIEDVRKVAIEVLGKDYKEIVQVATALRQRKVDVLPAAIGCIQSLTGYMFLINNAVAILRHQHEQQRAQVIVSRKSQGDTDLGANARAEIACGQILRNLRILEAVQSSMIDQLNGVKRVLEDMRWEWQQVGGVPDTARSHLGIEECISWGTAAERTSSSGNGANKHASNGEAAVGAGGGPGSDS